MWIIFSSQYKIRLSEHLDASLFLISLMLDGRYMVLNHARFALNRTVDFASHA